jgi:hypothetical protein
VLRLWATSGPKALKLGRLPRTPSQLADHVVKRITGRIGISDAQIEGSKLPKHYKQYNFPYSFVIPALLSALKLQALSLLGPVEEATHRLNLWF